LFSFLQLVDHFTNFISRQALQLLILFFSQDSKKFLAPGCPIGFTVPGFLLFQFYSEDMLDDLKLQPPRAIS